ncbi:hypothetical protein K1719_029911 [Acacia pycnantha]|nr:hypothetical protein K1719_029911 [Acacia pycnantha]
MDPHKRFGLLRIVSFILFLILIKDLSCSAFGDSEQEIIEDEYESTGGKVSEVFKQAASVNPHQFMMKKCSRPWTLCYYKAHVNTVLNRFNTFTNITYKNDPTIFAWELMNEPRCTSDPTGEKLQDWIQDIAAYVKSIDTKHLLEIELEGFYGPSTPQRVQFNPNTYAQQVGTYFIRNHHVLGVDFASVHIYPDS